jgi:hypothetical protein
MSMSNLTRHSFGLTQPVWAAIVVGLVTLANGCAAITNPVANGVPVRRAPPELLASLPREAMQTIPLTLLGQEPPKNYRLGPGDVLGVYVEAILPATPRDAPATNPPVYFPSQIDPLGGGLPPALGFPLAIRDDGTVLLPRVDAVRVAGMDVTQAANAISKAYTDRDILQAEGKAPVLVTLMQPRQTRVVVLRQEFGGFATGGRGDIAVSESKRGNGTVLALRAYENDVLHAITETGGLPGLDVFDEIIVFKGGQRNRSLVATLEQLPPDQDPLVVSGLCAGVVRIPTRIVPGQPLPFQPEDVILEDGDVVFLEARATELFYTGGLLPAGEHIIPRDYDLDVVEAVTRVQGSLLNGAFAGNNLSGVLVQPGLGNPSPSLLTVLRRTPGGGQVPIRVDLNTAMRDTRERIPVRPGDVLILQETPGESVARYLSQVFSFSYATRVISSENTAATAALAVP